MRGFLLVFFILLFQPDIWAQDPMFSQFYNAPNYLNPALNGQFDGNLRVNFIHRSSMIALESPFTYSAFTIDYNVPSFGGGFGLLAMRSNEGSTSYARNTLSGIYSYSVQWDYAVLSFGVSAGVGNLRYDPSKSTYYTQYGENGKIEGAPSFASEPTMNNRFYFDSGAGVNLVYFNAMVGVAVNHLNQADESFTNERSRIPMRINAHASYRFNLDYYDQEDGPTLIPSVVYYNQGQVSALSTGVQFKNKRSRIGLWYRDELKSNSATPRAFVLSLSFDIFSRSDSYDKVRIGLSHDVPFSKLGYSASGGSTEGALTWETRLRNSDNGRNENFGKRCFDFY